VFLTAYDQFAIRAFDAEAHDYLVKPVSEARFAATMKRLTNRLSAGAAVPQREQGIVVSTARGAVVVPLGDIDWIEAADNYARLWIGTRSYLLRESLAALEQRLSSHGFVRAHRQALVRLSAVRTLRSGEGGELLAVLACGARVRVSRRRRAAFVATVRSNTS
jgi:two-component system LytT family response regulator